MNKAAFAPSDAKPFVRSLRGVVHERPCFWLMRQAGRYLPEYRATRAQANGFVDLCLRPDLACEITLQPLRRYAMDAAILFSDILMVPYGLGQKLEFKEGEGPVLDAVRDGAAIAKLEKSGGEFDARVAPIYETVRRVAANLPGKTALIGFAGAPWTVATYMVEGCGSKDFANVRLLAYRDRIAFQALIDLLVRATIGYLKRQISAGAEAVQLFDTWAGVLPEGEYAQWVIDPVRRIVAALAADHPEIPVIFFPKGSGTLYETAAEIPGVAALGIDTAVPLAYARRLQAKVAVQGNLDPIVLAAGGEALDRAAGRILDTLGAGPFVFNLGHGVIPPTPPENVARLADLIRNWRAPR
ncbi:MAG: uroporphyrinogen decarboxylase [Alphaproteobacteria bacterium]|nr:uroporphyrinogen decarboxylase [Alphaproteobacteria bacterium]